MKKIVKIKVNNASEKLAALYFLSAKMNFPISKNVLSSITSESYDTMTYPYVFCDGMYITASCINMVCDIVIPFSELYRYDEILEKENEITIPLNSTHNAIVSKDNVTVGCQTFSHEAIEKLYNAVQKFKD